MNDIKLQEGHPVDENLRPIKVGGKSTALEVSKEDVRVNNLHINGTMSGGNHLPLAGGTMAGDIKVPDGFVLDGSGDMVLDAAGGEITLKQAGNDSMQFRVAGSPQITMYETSGATDDYFRIHTATNGATSLKTIDDAGADAHFTINVDGNIELDSESGVFDIKKSGTKFADLYAGTILGYTKIQNNSTTNGHQFISPDATLTVMQTGQGTDVSVTFVAPPSGNVEIQMTCLIYANSRTVEFALSDNATFNEVGEGSTYDAGAQSSDETDYNLTTVSFVNTGLTAGTSYERWIGVAETVSGTSAIYQGRNRTTGFFYPPIIVKAIALPATITTGE